MDPLAEFNSILSTPLFSWRVLYSFSPVSWMRSRNFSNSAHLVWDLVPAVVAVDRLAERGDKRHRALDDVDGRRLGELEQVLHTRLDALACGDVDHLEPVDVGRPTFLYLPSQCTKLPSFTEANADV